ncbi:immunity protein Tsi6 family protein [uncultured Shewanella sp.]|uniref:immunity protein Tsi6 family protein n=1 Tax=uncultured Shewanella sp. TaxID=173975 RepID=UPI0026351B7E|nr:immunity protein Tsi6 family protein [uncultured Shewanella sp.]
MILNNIEIVRQTKELIKLRLKQAPDFVIFKSIEAQLDYVLDILEGNTMDRSKLKDINVGHYAVHEFEESDPELANKLKKIQYFVYKMNGGIIR